MAAAAGSYRCGYRPGSAISLRLVHVQTAGYSGLNPIFLCSYVTQICFHNSVNSTNHMEADWVTFICGPKSDTCLIFFIVLLCMLVSSEP